MGLLEHGTHVEHGLDVAERIASRRLAPEVVPSAPPRANGPRRYDKRARAAAVPLSRGWVKHVYEDAIEFSGIPKKLRGFCFLVFIVMGLLAIGLTLLFSSALTNPFDASTDWAGIVLDLVWVLVVGVPLYFLFDVVGTFMRVDLFSPEDLPVIFDRRHGKVYRLLQDVQPSWKGLFTRFPVVACEYDWDLVDVEYETRIFSERPGDQLHLLNFLVRKSAADPALIARIQIAHGDALAGGKADALWEHIRRFMDEAGPALQDPSEPLARLEAATSWWESMGRIGPFGAYSRERWKKSPWVTFFIVAMFPVTLPVFLVWGTGHYLSFRTARRVEWPKAVRGRVGWPLEQAPDRGAFSGVGR